MLAYSHWRRWQRAIASGLLTLLLCLLAAPLLCLLASSAAVSSSGSLGRHRRWQRALQPQPSCQ